MASMCGISYAIYNKYSGEAPAEDDKSDGSKAHNEIDKDFENNDGDVEN